MNTAQIILDQIKTIDPRATWAWGARDMVALNAGEKHDGALVMTVSNNPNYRQAARLEISLAFNDTYTIRLYRIRKHEVKELEVKTDIYCDMLVDVIDAILG